MKDQLEMLILIGRPGAGKSEIIDYLKKQSEEDRRERFGIGPFVEIDDFPMLWTWFEEDQLLEQMGRRLRRPPGRRPLRKRLLPLRGPLESAYPTS